MLCVIMIIRLHAMYQGSRKMVVFLVTIFLALAIAIVVNMGKMSSYITLVFDAHQTMLEESVLSGFHMCVYSDEVGRDYHLWLVEIWIIGTVWQVLALCLAVWVAVKHFRELRQTSTAWTARDCFTVLIKTHVFYFAVIVPIVSNSAGELYRGILQLVGVVQMFILGPRLILGVRQYNAKLVADSDEGTCMTMIAFHEPVQSIGSDVV
ncbi:hypothetical protein K503DRAFT_860510 [Rhizopogon vinicolor AM-OR11-026]|uniref:G-protein coupled receptors family 3 profile domain-containing protein n=1 Tax=Rhizopogon vinicolor AM-OR11-026 TaxID=1314800 RepID=A0A1B7MHH1_9AGAM|nr:hypothetical protein K503DRAFT_860510 [Rhizopogon vinicolor AM-OR11-026]